MQTKATWGAKSGGKNPFFANFGTVVFRLLVEDPLRVLILRYQQIRRNLLLDLLATVYYVKMHGRRNPFPSGAPLLVK